MSEGSDGAEREHNASAKRRSEFSSKGEVPKSKDLLNAVVLLVGVRCIITMGSSVGNVIMSDMRSTLGQLRRELDAGLMYEFGSHFCHSVLPISALAAIAAVVSGVLQHRGVPPWHLPGFNLNRINPIGKLGDLFSPKKAGLTIGISLLKAGVLGIIFYATLHEPLMAYVGRVPSSIKVGMDTAGGLIEKVLMRGLVMMVLFGLLDYGISWWRLEKRMRMTVQELRDENKEDNGDPKIKGRRRKLAQQLIQQRSVKNVTKADVVLVNPTHYAVAISYQDGRMAAPTVVAKGADALAEKIRGIARSSGVPIVSQPPLTRLLYAEVKVGGAIPAATYQAVAVILAHVYRLRRRAS
jgi:flagellar biosynthetic protein FlhB